MNEIIHETWIDSVGLVVYELAEDDGSIMAYLVKDEDKYQKIKENQDSDVTSLIYDDDFEQIGTVEVTDGWLDSIEVDKSYQKQEIGTTLVALAINRLYLSKISCLQESKENKYDLTIDGEQLIASCVKKQVVTPDMCRNLENYNSSITIKMALDSPKKEFKLSKIKLSHAQQQRKITDFFKSPTRTKVDEEMKHESKEEKRISSSISKKRKAQEDIDSEHSHNAKKTATSRL